MVKSDQISSFFRLIRWHNLVIVAATQILVRQCIIVPVLRQVDMEPQLSIINFILLVIATVCITAGGYIINDYFDRKIDRINRPDVMVVGTHVHPRHAMAYHLLFSTTGIVCGVWVALNIQQFYLSIIFFMVSGLLWFYSTTYKREFLLGNFVVALLTALVPFIVLVFEMPLLARAYGAPAHAITKILFTWVIGFSIFAFIINLLREIVKDTEDLEGDSAYGKKTIPVVWGVKAARVISVLLIAAVIALLAFSWFYYVRDIYTMVYFLVMIVIPLLVALVLLIKGGGQTLFHNVSLILKAVMFTGICYMIVVNLLINFLQ